MCCCATSRPARNTNGNLYRLRGNGSMSITVVHPQVQHSYQVVWALADANLLESYLTSCFFRPDRLYFLPHSLRREFAKRFHPNIPENKVFTFPYLELAWNLCGKVVSAGLHERLFYHNVWAFDAFMAKRVSNSAARVVIGYENSCREIFKAAKKVGKYCVLDAASVHYLSQKEVYRPPFSESFLKVVNSVKEEEIFLADHILTLSNYAKETYVQAGVSASKITVISLGVDCSKFKSHNRRHSADGLRFLFVGNIKNSKGIDLLLAAFKRIEIPGKQLLIIGAPGDASHLLHPLPEGVSVKGPMPHDQLRTEYERADIFVLPSRMDGFGMVVAEAMATGTPVLVSSHVGAKDLVNDGVNGWIFNSGDVEGLARRMQQAYDQRINLVCMGEFAQMTAMNYTWDVYREKIINFYKSINER
jgi:glycosyltransferase involved in cell wall biosynthesis